MNVPISSSLIKRIKHLVKRIRKNKDGSKDFLERCANTKGVAAEMLRQSVSMWEFIHDSMGREVRFRKLHKIKKRKKKHKHKD